MSVIGTVANPMRSVEPMKVARCFMEGRFETPNGQRGLVEFNGSFFEWYGERWTPRDKEWLKGAAWLWLEDAHHEVQGQNGVVVAVRYSPVREEVSTVVECVGALARVDRQGFPVWLGKMEESPNMDYTIAFRDYLVDVRETVKKGELVARPRDERWFDVSVLPVDLKEEAECPLWKKCIGEWGGGDPEWEVLLQRYFGYVLMASRRYAKWLLMQGKIRAGKGTIASVLRMMLGDVGFVGLRMGDLVDKHGLDGLQHARALVVSEVSDELDNREGERVAALWKNVLGRDPITVNPKNVRQIRNVVLNAAPIMLSNVIPKLPNKGRGLSGKMLVLPFGTSFEGRENFELLDQLKEELEGIAAWALKGAVDLERETQPDKKFVTPKEGKAVLDRYHLYNNPFDGFLTARFRKNRNGFVSTKIIVRQWHDWLKSNNVKLHVARNVLVGKLMEESTWDITRFRQANGGARGLKGLSLLEEYDDDTE